MLLDLSRLDLPTPPERLFGRDAPLVLEVGYGNGSFLTGLAAQHPAWNVLGAEVSLSSVTRAFKRVRQAGCRNVRLYKGSALFLLRDVVPLRSLHRVYVNFPDPWHKKAHRGRRILQAPFFRLLSTRLADGGSLWLTTDHEEYFFFAREEARATGLFDVTPGTPPAETLETRYARKWQSQQKSFYHAVFTKTGEAPELFEPLIRRVPMQHARLAGPLPTLDGFEKEVHPFRAGHVILMEAYVDAGGDGLVFFVRAEEPDLAQDVLIEARPAREGVLVGVKTFGQPLVTDGIGEAVRVVAEWLAARGMTVTERYY